MSTINQIYPIVKSSVYADEQNIISLDKRGTIRPPRQKENISERNFLDHNNTQLSWQDVVMKQMIMEMAYNMYDDDCPYSVQNAKHEW